MWKHICQLSNSIRNYYAAMENQVIPLFFGTWWVNENSAEWSQLTRTHTYLGKSPPPLTHLRKPQSFWLNTLDKGFKVPASFPPLCDATSTRVGWLESREVCLHTNSPMTVTVLILKRSHIIFGQHSSDLTTILWLLECFSRHQSSEKATLYQFYTGLAVASRGAVCSGTLALMQQACL